MGILNYASNTMRARVIAGDEPGWLRRHKRRNYIVAAYLAKPPWVSRRSLAPFDNEAKAKTLSTGVPHSVDHIIALRHPLVCGLTVPWNLQVIPAAMNHRKGNDLNAELFDDPEQLRML